MSFITTGATAGSSPNRLEINDFVKNDKFFSLYIQALQAMSADDQANPVSFFSLAGIHGLPYQSWDNVNGNPPFDPNSDQWGGYCTHGSVLFPTWHRPYVMLYEQILQQRAQEIATMYTVDTTDWKQAADSIRVPYWDWAMNAVPPDEVIALQQVTITIKDGTTAVVDNPLYQYKFHPIDPSFPSPYSEWPTTLRQPDSTDPDATHDVENLKAVMNSAGPNITSSTYNVLTRVTSWPAFSNHTVGDGGSTSNSLEAIHDGIHVDVGGSGQMADPSVAAFDPIFFLHHCNVDRMLALWSALNPGTWVTDGVTEDGGSYTTERGVPVNENTGLTPFWNDPTTFWASAVVQDTIKLGYTYPEFNGLDLGNPSALQAGISAKVNQLYGSSVFGSSFAVVPPSVPASSVKTRSVADTATKKAPATSLNHTNPAPHHTGIPGFVKSLADTAKHALSLSPSQNTPAPQQHSQVTADRSRELHPHPHPAAGPHIAHEQQSFAAPNRGLWEWTARVEFKKYELGTSFSVLIFLGPVPEYSRALRTSPNYVGGHHAFVNSAANRCANCVNQRDMVIEGFVHLNLGIVKHSGLPSLEPEVVVPYLTENLNWVVQQSNGAVVGLESLEVAVFATPLTYPPNAAFPVPGPAVRYNQITHGRVGGSRQG